MKDPTDCVSQATRDCLSAFRTRGKLEGAQRRELNEREVAGLIEGLREQMTEIARLDNVLELDKDVARGQVESNILGDDIKLTVHFRGSVRSGTFAGVIAPSHGESSEFIAEFGTNALTLVQKVDRGDGSFGTLAACLKSGEGGFIDSQALPEGAPLLL